MAHLALASVAPTGRSWEAAAMQVAPEIDLLAGDMYGEVARRAYGWMRRNAPVHFDERNGVWGLATYDGVLAASRDRATFSSAGGSRPKVGPLPWMIDMDGPDHSRRRGLVSRAFTPARVRASMPHVERLCDDLIDRVCERGACDVVRDLAAPLPMIVIGDMLGVDPSDRDQLLAWSDDLIGALDPSPERLDAAATAFTAFDAYARGVVAARRAEPRDDLVSVLVHAEVDGDRLSDDQIVFESMLILLGGDETTRHVISGGLEALLRNPGQRQHLERDPAALGPAVEEMLRWVSPIKNMARTVTSDVDLLGARLRAGDEVVLLYESANFDDAHFADPDTFDIGRSPNDHVAFGFGAHFCLGASLARVEVRTMIDRVLHRLPGLERDGDEPPSRFLGALTALPVRFTPTAPVAARPA